MDFTKKMLLILGIMIVSLSLIFAVSTFQPHKSSQNLQNQSQNGQINLQWNTDLNSGLKMAVKSNKLVFIDFYADWCGYCKKLDTETFSDNAVKQKFAQSYVLVRVNVDQNPDLASKYNIYGLPTMVILDSSGNELKRQEGFVTAQQLLNML
jgi:thioredoxin 1